MKAVYMEDDFKWLVLNSSNIIFFWFEIQNDSLLMFESKLSENGIFEVSIGP